MATRPPRPRQWTATRYFLLAIVGLLVTLLDVRGLFTLYSVSLEAEVPE